MLTVGLVRGEVVKIAYVYDVVYPYVIGECRSEYGR